MNNRSKKLQRLGSLECVYRPGEDGGPLIVFFHGYGADCWDLASFSEVLDVPGATWVFPNGMLEVPIGPGMTGRAWFPIDMIALNAAMMSGTHRDMSQARPDGLDKALAASQGFFAALGVEDYSHVIVGGFSQGAMLTLDTLLSAPISVSGAVLLSGTLLDQVGWGEKLKLREPIPFFQSHGSQDPLLSFSTAQKLEQMLRGSGWKGHLRGFKGGHEIPQQVLSELQGFLTQIVSVPHNSK